MIEKIIEKRRRGIYLLPNLLTTLALFSGFYAIVMAMRGAFEPAAVAIFVAMIFDGLDGRLARLTHTQTAFGAQYDSLSDMVAFGVAPALVIYTWALYPLGKLGWLAAFVYTAATALRLARFNVQVAHVDKRFFIGLSSPAAAAHIAACVWLGADNGRSGTDFAYILLALTFVVALLMISPIRYYSFKDISSGKYISFLMLLALIGLLVMISLDPPIVLLFAFLVYSVSGIVWELWRARHRLRSCLRRKKSVT